MMASGTRNENPTLDRLRSSVKCMKEIFEVGLLRWNRNHAIGIMQLGYHRMQSVVLLWRTHPIQYCAVWRSKRGFPKVQLQKQNWQGKSMVMTNKASVNLQAFNAVSLQQAQTRA
ncbi:hypothetical protein IV203_038645 [Nitzschia inconspicua]|uniref:Uncharacterized protein n=1 Tax=Nitzschia inconspicua TaxID=303405 RepID=A0A9K3PZM7_9STRA|nr:hypothetical protein IV203_038645 [Nitzschia inconspicua]